jgi:hypothetical protein
LEDAQGFSLAMSEEAAKELEGAMSVINLAF